MDTVIKNDFKIFVDPLCNYHYVGFYLQGFQNLYPDNTVYDLHHFQDVMEDRRTCFYLKILHNNKLTKIIIDFHDSNGVYHRAFDWADVYSKINYHPTETRQSIQELFGEEKAEELEKKIKIIQPSFGIRAFTHWQAASLIFKTLWNSKKIDVNTKNFVMSVLRMQIKRTSLGKYNKGISKPFNVFHVSTIWPNNTQYVNINRANFIKACKDHPLIHFEGGMVDIGYDNKEIPHLDQVLIGNKKISISEYLAKTKESRFVFNGPSVLRCHGWKFGEYMAMGKAIISVPIHNDLPVPLEHGKNIHFVEETPESISEAVDYLINNPEYVKKLEEGAHEYWQKYMMPEIVVKEIVSEIQKI